MKVTVKDAGDLRAVSKALRAAANGKELRKALVKEIRGELRPMVENVKQAWRSAPSKGAPHPGRPSLRSALAKATRGEVRLTGRQAGVRVRTDGRKMPDGMKSLPTYAEGTKRPWRHPVYGDPDVWTQQQPFPRFYDAVEPNEHRARREVERAVQDVFRKIVRAK